MKQYLSFEELKKMYKNRPKSKFLWSGIKEKSFGLVFGPSKSGKTIFCENLAHKLATGSQDYFGYPLDGKPKKVLFLGLEEFWESRIERNIQQINPLSQSEKELINSNFLYQPIDFKRNITKKEHWKELELLIQNSEAEVVFIDSITRLNPGKIEQSDTAEQIMQNLRSITYDNGITMICIHHTPKMYDSLITIDKIKGSSVFAQESDFAFGINRTSKGYRYMKEVFFRYKSDDIENVKEFVIDENTNLDFIGLHNEEEIINRSDRRRSDSRDSIVNFLNKNSDHTYKTNELVYILNEELNIKDRQSKTYLQNLVKDGKICQPKRGLYTSVINFYNDRENDEARK